MPKIVLILMVKNEEKIIQRCMAAVEGVVDAYVVTDTGSTDKTVEVASEFLEKHEGTVEMCTWKDFGHNRTISFKNAQNYCKSKNWDLKQTYGLLLDGDMVFVPGTLKQQSLGEVGYTLIQSAGNLDYPNTRLVRMDYDWVCRGVTHEYWDGESKALPKEVAYIDDRNDGGCKDNKFPRDLALLLKGVQDEPNNIRYWFYLAQTYHSLGKFEEAIEAYKTRIEMGGWFEEVWYSHYMIAKSYETLNNPILFEEWVQKAYQFYPKRAEALYHLVKHLRLKGEFFKAMHYIQIGKRIPLSTDSLFIERDVYSGLFDYEETVCRYYTLGSKKEALRHSMKYLMQDNPFLDSVYSNLKYYIEILEGEPKPYPIPRDLFGPNFHPSHVSLSPPYHNIRFVNYNLNHTNTTYTMKDGSYSDTNPVMTQNACYNEVTKEITLMDDLSTNLPKIPANVKGLEDVRIYRDLSGDMRFNATVAEYVPYHAIMRGKYDPDTGKYSDCIIMESPTGSRCEKNWLAVPGTDDIIYHWFPLQVGKYRGSKLDIHTRHLTPWFFRHLRGSGAPVKVKNELWALTHFVIGEHPRHYFSCVVALDGTSYRPKRISVPFLFHSTYVEFCSNLRVKGKTITCIYSTLDDNLSEISFQIKDDDWIQVYR
jgi:glycosyltransferase involved in cell wall biosynthesis